MPATLDPADAGTPAETVEPRLSDLPPDASSAPGILAAVDGSDGSLWALDRAMTEAELFGLPLYILSVVNPSPGGYTLGTAEVVQGSIERLLDITSEGLRRGVRAVQAARSRPYSGPMSLHVVLGNVIETVLTSSAHQHTLVMGTRGNGGFARLLLGSVSTAAVHHASCPVLIVPAPPGDRTT